uniref:Late blight resistance protein n=1 Tax=Solanum tuberosum TaxID=4113 RepID=M1DE92_SOLTU
MGQNYMKIFKRYTDEVKDPVIDVLKTQLKDVTVLTAGDEYLGDHNIIQSCVNSVSNRQKNVPSTSNDGNLENLSDRVVSLEQSMVEVVTYVRKEKLRRIEKNKKKKQEKVDEDLAAVDEDFVAIDKYFTDGVDEMTVDAVDKVTGDHVDEVVVDEVAGDVIDEVADDGVAVDDVVGDDVAVDDVAEFPSHTRTFNVLMPFGLHLIMMQTQVIRINIQRIVDPVDQSESVVVRMIGVLVPTSLIV